MRTEHARIEPNTTYPIAEETGILSGREALLGPTLCGKKVLSRLPVHHTQVIINRLPGLFGDLEPYRSAGLLLWPSPSKPTFDPNRAEWVRSARQISAAS
jgi:hypothetical protein